MRKNSKRNPANPLAGLSAAPRPAQRRASPRRLTERQLSNPLIRVALPRLSAISQNRGRYLRRLDTVHASGRRTRAEVFANLAAVAEALLCRLDLATGVLGWLDDAGQFRLNTQRDMAEDCGISSAQLCRLLGLMEACGYADRRTNRIQVCDAGLQLVRTRCLVRLTPRFFRDLGLAEQHERAQRGARKRRAQQEAVLASRQAEHLTSRALERAQREQRRRRWEASQLRRSSPAAASHASEAVARAMNDLRLALRLEHPDWSAAQVNAEAERIFQERAT